MSLRKAIRQIGETFDKVENLYYGDLGIVKGNKKLVKVPNRPGFVYVRLRGARSELITAHNDKVEEKYGTPVVLKREGNRYSVIGKNWERYQDWDNENPSLPKHANTHTFDKDGNVIGSDGVFISGYQFLPYLLCPLQNNSTNAFIYPFADYFNDQWTYYGNTGTISFTPYKPVSGTSLVLVSIDYENGNPYYQATTGTYISPMVTGISQILPHLPTPPTGTIVPIGAVRLTNTTQSIGWLNIYDLRKHYETVVTGGAGGAGGAVDSVNGQTGVVTLVTDDIAEDGSPTNLWFTGARAIASLLTGFSAGAGTVSASDSILQAFQKVVGNIALKLTANAPITGATKTKITYDANGLVTAGADLSASDVPANPGLFEARLSLSSTLAVPTADLTGQGTIYLHPYKGYRIALYDGSKWVHHDLSSAISLAFSGLSFSATCYDLFVYDSSGLTLEAVAWTNATTRATALGKQDGIEVKAADPTRRYCGTVYIDSSKQASMEFQIAGNTTTIGRRHVWNRYNQIYQATRKVSTSSHTYASSTYRKWNNTDVMSIEMVIGILENDISIYAGGNQYNNANLDVAVNWSSGGGELVDWFNPTASGISAFTGGHLRMQRAGDGLNTFNVIESASSGTATFSTAVVDIGCFS